MKNRKDYYLKSKNISFVIILNIVIVKIEKSLTLVLLMTRYKNSYPSTPVKTSNKIERSGESSITPIEDKLLNVVHIFPS